MRRLLNINGLPYRYPTHVLDPEFWEELGRAIATFGFLEKVLGTTIIAQIINGVNLDDESDVSEISRRLPMLERAVHGTLVPLIRDYEESIRHYQDSTIHNLDGLVEELKGLAESRNFLIHASWREPDENGMAVPVSLLCKSNFFVGGADVSKLRTIRAATVEAACRVVNSYAQKNCMPNFCPTHGHEPVFWEELGRAVATFGFLEDVLRRAIIVLRTTHQYLDDGTGSKMSKQLRKLERSFSDSFLHLVENYENTISSHKDSTIYQLDDLVEDLKSLSVRRNVLCHGSWRKQNKNGASLPLFVDREMELFCTPIDVYWLRRIQVITSNVAYAVINSVAHMGLPFPGNADLINPIR